MIYLLQLVLLFNELYKCGRPNYRGTSYLLWDLMNNRQSGLTEQQNALD